MGCRTVPSLLAACAAVAASMLPGDADATVRIAIDLTHQRMHVDGEEGRYDWPISSARSGFSTPGGSYAPTHLELMHYSRKYHMSPMPHAIFFRGGYAIHGTYSTASLGRPASHGCVRLSPGNAARLYDMVSREGGRISISGSPPGSRRFDGESSEEARYDGARRTRASDADADALARLAPRSNYATAAQTYGDAAYARRRAYRQTRYRGYGLDEGAAYAYTPYPPAPFPPNYTLTPSYYSAPQIAVGSPYAVGSPFYEQTPLLPFGTE